MFDSGVEASVFIGSVISEADIAPPIPMDMLVNRLNELEQMLYSEFIREQSSFTPVGGGGKYTFPVNVRFEDVFAVTAGGVQLKHSTLFSGGIFPDTYYKDGEGIGVNTDRSGVRVYHYVRPPLKTINNGVIAPGRVCVPPEFLDLVGARLRGEAYKFANEDNLAGKWLNDYNTHLENFKTWLDIRRPNFGI